MKKNVMLLSCAALLALALAGCSQSTAQADYIGTDAAKAIALEAAGIGEADATFTTAELETRNNTPYYEVDFTAGGQEYDYDIDALTGTVIAGNQQAAGSTGNTDGSTGDTAITADKATPNRAYRQSSHNSTRNPPQKYTRNLNTIVMV